MNGCRPLPGKFNQGESLPTSDCRGTRWRSRPRSGWKPLGLNMSLPLKLQRAGDSAPLCRPPWRSFARTLPAVGERWPLIPRPTETTPPTATKCPPAPERGPPMCSKRRTQQAAPGKMLRPTTVTGPEAFYHIGAGPWWGLSAAFCGLPEHRGTVRGTRSPPLVALPKRRGQ